MQFVLKSQHLRFKLECKQLKETFGEFVSFHNIAGETRVEVTAKTSKNNPYTLRCYMRNDYPNSMPDLVVCSPDEPLKDKNGEPLKMSYENHCLGFDNEYGLTTICHCRQDRWDKQNMNLCQVFIKGLIWLEGYEIIKATGETMTFLPEMPMSEEMLEKLQKLQKRQIVQCAEQLEDFVNHMMFEFNCRSVEELFSRLCFVQEIPEDE